MSTTAQQQQTEDDAFLLQVARDCLQQQLYASAEFHALRLLTAATSESGSQLTAEAAAILGESLFHRHEYRRAMVVNLCFELNGFGAYIGLVFV